jgi:hypothetical protein
MRIPQLQRLALNQVLFAPAGAGLITSTLLLVPMSAPGTAGVGGRRQCD